METRRYLTREQVLAWREGWSESDRRRMCDYCEVQQVVSFYEPASKQYVGCRDAEGRGVMFVYPGYVEFPKSRVPAGLDRNWIILSTFKGRDPRPDVEPESSEVCPHCFLQLPLTGVCDCRD